MAGAITITKKGNLGISKSIKQYDRFKKTIPNILAVNSANHFKKGFSSGGKQTDESQSGWKARSYTKGKGSRNTLVKTGTLQKDIKKKKATFRETIVGTSNLTSKYASLQNEGGIITITSQMRKFFWAQYYKTKDSFWMGMALHKGNKIEIPKREYIGDSKKLELINENSIKKQMTKVFK